MSDMGQPGAPPANQSKAGEFWGHVMAWMGHMQSSIEHAVALSPGGGLGAVGSMLSAGRQRLEAAKAALADAQKAVGDVEEGNLPQAEADGMAAVHDGGRVVEGDPNVGSVEVASASPLSATSSGGA